MKKNFKLIGLFAIAFAVMFSSCKKDEPTPEEKALNSIEGTWSFTTADAGSDSNIDISGSAITFSTDKTYSISSISVLNDNNLNLNDDLAASGSFTIDPDNETITIGASVIGYSVDSSNGDLTLTYTAPYPKVSSEDANIALNASLQ